MNLFEDTNPRELKEMLGQIQSGISALPDFQRDFVWDPSATQELISLDRKQLSGGKPPAGPEYA